MMSKHIRTVLADLPAKVKAFTIDVDDDYTIVLNQNLSREQNMRSYLHELLHIGCKDFEKSNVGEIENSNHERM